VSRCSRPASHPGIDEEPHATPGGQLVDLAGGGVDELCALLKEYRDAAAHGCSSSEPFTVDEPFEPARSPPARPGWM